jgi:hypothetical protein
MSSKLFVGGITPTTGTQELTDYFSQFGTLVDAIAMSQNGQSRGFGFVEFSSPEEAAQTLAFGPHVIDGRTVDVKGASPRGTPGLTTPAYGLSRTAGGFRGAMGRFGARPPLAFNGVAYSAPPAYAAPTYAAPAYGIPAYGAPGPMRTRMAAISPYGAPMKAYGAPGGGYAAAAAGAAHAKVFVGGLPQFTTEDSLIGYFSQFGTVVQCEIMRREGGVSRGFAFIIFAHPHEAAAACATQFQELDGRMVEVKQSLPKGAAPPPVRSALSAPYAFGGAPYRAAPPAFGRGFSRGYGMGVPRFRPY